MGAPTSPIVSNLCSYELDMKLMRFCELNQVTYSRYADDLTFSSNGNISNELIQSLIQMIRENGFEINYKKNWDRFKYTLKRAEGPFVNCQVIIFLVGEKRER